MEKVSVKIINNCESTYIITFDKQMQLKIEAKTECSVDLQQFNSFKVEAWEPELNKIELVASYVVGFLVAVFLSFINYFNMETLEKSVEFPVCFHMRETECEKNPIVIELYKNEQNLFICAAKMDGNELKGDLLITEELLKSEVKKYIESNLLIYFIPFAIIIIISILLIIKIRTIPAVICILCFYVLFCIPIFLLIRKNNKFIKDIRNRITQQK